MPIHLIVAYTVFILVPAGLALSIALRRREVERQIETWRSEARTYPPEG